MQFRPSYLMGLNELVVLAYVQNLGLLMKRAPDAYTCYQKNTSIPCFLYESRFSIHDYFISLIVLFDVLIVTSLCNMLNHRFCNVFPSPPLLQLHLSPHATKQPHCTQIRLYSRHSNYCYM